MVCMCPSPKKLCYVFSLCYVISLYYGVSSWYENRLYKLVRQTNYWVYCVGILGEECCVGLLQAALEREGWTQ